MREMARKAAQWARDLRAPSVERLELWARERDWESFSRELARGEWAGVKHQAWLSKIAADAAPSAPAEIIEALVEAGASPFESICRVAHGYMSVSESLLETMGRRGEWEAWSSLAKKALASPEDAERMRFLDQTRPILARAAALKRFAPDWGVEPSSGARAWAEGAAALMKAGAGQDASVSGPDALFFKSDSPAALSVGAAERFASVSYETADSVWLLSELLRAGAPPDAQCSGRAKGPLLMSAALHGLPRSAQALLAAGADPLARSGDGRSAAHWACEGSARRAASAGSLWIEGGGKEQMTTLLETLFEGGVDFGAVDHQGRSARDQLGELSGPKSAMELLDAYDETLARCEARALEASASPARGPSARRSGL